MSDLDLRLVVESLFRNKSQLDQVMAAIKGFQEGQATRNAAQIQQNKQIIQQMVQMGTLSKEQLSGINRALSSNAFPKVTRDAKAAGDAIKDMGDKGKFTVRVLEAFVLYRGFVFLQQGAVNTTKALIDLNHQIRLIQTQLPNFGAGQGDFLRQGIFAVSRETGVSFNQTADALYNITSAGYSGAQAIRILDLSMKAAVAGGLKDADTAFNSALSSINAFGLSADSLESVLDKQFAAVRRGIFTYEQFGTQVGVVSEAFATAGQSIETTYAAMATVSQVFTGPQFARGATGIRALAESLTTNADDFAAIGVAVLDAEGNFRDLTAILTDLKRVTDSLPTGEKASLIASIIPDTRQRQGLQALLSNLDDLKRNYVEQKLALGDLSKAYGTFESDGKKQLDILKNSVQSGFGPMADRVGELAGFINKADDAIPGFTSGIVAMTGAVTALALATSYLNKEMMVNGAMSTRGGAFANTLTSPIGGGRFGRYATPLTAGGAIAGFALGQGGADWGSAASAIGAGALSGSFGGPAGMAAGAAISLGTYLLSALTSSKADDAFKESGKTFAEAFAEALKERGGDVAAAYSKAFANAGLGTPSQAGFDIFTKGVLRGGGPGGMKTFGYRPDALAEAKRLGLPESSVQYLNQGGDKVFGLQAPPTEFRTRARETFLDVYRRINEDRAAITGSTSYMLASPENRASTLADATTGSIGKYLSMDEEAQKLFAWIFTSTKGLEQFSGALDAAARGPEALVDFINGLATVGIVADNLAAKLERMSKAISGDFGVATDIFQRMGVKPDSALGRALFQTQAVERAQAGMSAVQSLAALQINGTNPFGGAIDMDRLMQGFVGYGAQAGDRIQQSLGGADLTDEILKLFTGTAAGDGAANLSPFTTDLENKVRYASEHLNELGDSFGYTAEALAQFAGDLRDYNKTVFKIGIIEEIQRLGEVAGYDPKTLDPVIKGLIDGIKLGGTSFADFFKDPTKLADLLAELEFSDVNVDNSINANVVVRISGDANLDVSKGAEIGQAIAMELNNVTRKTVGG